MELCFVTPLETVMERNESLCGSKSGCHISHLSASTQTELGNLLAVCCQAKVKNSDMHHCFTETLKAEVSQSGFNTLQDLWFYASWRGLLILQELLLMHGLLTQKSGSHSHFVTALPVLILVSLSSSFLTSSKWLYRGKCCDNVYLAE